MDALQSLVISENLTEAELMNHRKLWNHRTTSNSSLLHLASLNDTSLAIQLLIEHAKVNVNAKNEYGETPLHWACQHGNTNIVTFLLAHGAQVDCQDGDGNPPLHWA